MTNHLFVTIIFLILAANMQVRSAPQSFTGKIKICVQAEKTFQRGMCVCVEVGKHWQLTCLRDQDRLLQQKGHFILRYTVCISHLKNCFTLIKLSLCKKRVNNLPQSRVDCVYFLLMNFLDGSAARLQLFKSTPTISATCSDEVAGSSNEAEDTSEALEHGW